MRRLARISAVVVLILVAFEVLHNQGVISGTAYKWMLPIMASYGALELLIFSFSHPTNRTDQGHE
jgi:hypothetical protein